MAERVMRNILLVTADEWRGDCLSAVGHPTVRTPNLDALAADGVLFRNHFSQATPCGPARASLYTGMYAHNHRSVDNGIPLDARHTNLALEVRRAGLDPALFGYTDTMLDPRHLDPEDVRGKTYHQVLPGMTPVVAMDDHFRPWIAHLKRKGHDVTTEVHGVFRPVGDDGLGRAFSVSNHPPVFAAEDSQAAFLVDEVIDYLSVNQDRPWLVHISSFTPHPPFVAPEPYNTMYDPAQVGDPVRAPTVDEEAAAHPWLRHYLHNQGGSPFTVGAKSGRDNLRLTQADLRQIRATYYGMISEFDAQMGRLIDHLKRTEAYDDTLIIVTSDHGEHLGDHWMFAKNSCFDQTFHVPLIVRDPSGAAAARGTQVDAFTEAIDVMPTILDWLGLNPPAQCDGASLMPFCRGASVPEGWRTEAFSHFDYRNARDGDGNRVENLPAERCALTVLRGKRFKYVHFTALPALLFDLDNDPHELRNLADDPAYAGVVREHAQRMLSWRMSSEQRIVTA